MTQITAKVIADSVNTYDQRITTLELQYPRFIHSEFMTHRVFSRNAASSRAIPVAKMIRQVQEDPAMPIHWGANQPGMQAASEIQGDARILAAGAWINAAGSAALAAQELMALGVHKQVANRLLEPFQLMRTIVTATEWGNFFHLRDHEDAQPEIRALAVAMRDAMEASTPKRLREGEWHLPYVLESEVRLVREEVLRMLSTARCARVSYLTHDGQTPDVDKDIALYERLVGSHPIHASPAEHQATPAKYATDRSGNFKGWIQHRKLIEGSFA